MKSSKLLLILIAIFGFAGNLQAGVYFTGRAVSATSIQTDRSSRSIADLGGAATCPQAQGASYPVLSARTGIYIRTDENGNLYIDRGGAERPHKKEKGFSAAQDRRLKKTAVKETETKVRINGNQVLVPVALGYQGKEIQAEFLLDTGASIVVMHRELAQKLGVEKNESARFVVPGGRTIATDVAVLNYVEVGPFKQKKLRVAVIDHRGKSIPYQGLLGMNFLRHFYYRIDFKKQVIIWSR